MKKFFFALLLIATFGYATEVVDDLSTLEILTPSLQDCETLKLRLGNGLEAFLISDPGAHESGVALTVEAGSWQDPVDFPGQAHFTEHLLFLGNDKYPEENGFRHFLDAHGGRANAYTADQITNYMFTVQNSDLAAALDRFANFFIDPLFDEGAMRREENAVDQEFQRAIQHDGWRQEMIEKELRNPNHPASHFGFGNIGSLHALTSEEARVWFEEHYSSNLMHLVVYSALPVETLQELVTADFSAIPNRDLGPFVDAERIRSKEMEGQTVYVKPYQQIRMMKLSWELPYDHSTYNETKAAGLIGYWLGYEGEGSLLSELKRQGLAEGLMAGPSAFEKPYTPTFEFDIRVMLTREGVQRRDEVLATCLEAIKLVQKRGIPKELADETQTMSKLSYAYQTRGNVFDLVSTHAKNLVEEDLATYPDKTILLTRYDSREIVKIAKEMTPETCHVMVAAAPKETAMRHAKRDPHMGAQYTVQPPLSVATVQPELFLPDANPYLPENLAVFYNEAATEPTPELISDNGFGQVYFAQDTQFQVPQIAWKVVLKSQAVDPTDPTNAVLLDLMIHSAGEALNEEAYNAHVAGLSYGLTQVPYGIELCLTGYSDKAPLLFSKTLNALANTRPTEEQFAIYKESLTRHYENFAKKSPAEQALELAKDVIYEERISPRQKAEAIAGIDRQMLVEFFDAFRESTYAEAFLYGNLDAGEAENLTAMIQGDYQKEPFPEGKLLRRKVLSLPENRGPYYLVKRSPVEGNAAILIVEDGPFSFESRAAQQLVSMAIEEPFFTSLRTEQQTGYVVQSWDQEMELNLYSFFLVQSTTHDGRDLLARYEQLIEGFLKTPYPEERFYKLQTALVTKLEQAPQNPKAMTNHLWSLAFKYDDFDWREKRINGVQSLTYEAFQNYAHEFLGPRNRRRIAILLDGKTPALRYRRLPSPSRLKTHIGQYTSRTDRELALHND